MLGLDPDLAPFLDHVHRPVLVGQLDVSVLQHHLEAVGVAGLGQEPPGLGPVLLGVPSEARVLLELGRRHRPLRAGTRERPHVPEPRERVQDLAPGVPIDPQVEGLPHANVGERLHGVVHGDVEVDDEGGLLDDDLVAELLRDGFHLGHGQIAELDVGAAGPDRRGPHGCLGADEVLVAVEIGPVFDEVVGVPLALERRAARVALELEGAGAHDVVLEVVRILVEVLLRKDDVRRRGEVCQKGRRRELQLEDDGAWIRGFHARHRRVVMLPDAADPFGRKEDLVVASLDVGGRQRRAVVETDVLTDLERVSEPVRRDLPFARHVADDVRVAVGVDLEQRAVERRDRLDGGEGLFLVRVEARRVGADGRQEDSAAARGLRGLRPDGRGDQERTDRERQECDERHRTPPE